MDNPAAATYGREAMQTTGSYAAGNFEFQIDGGQPTSYIKSVDGGWSRGILNQEKDTDGRLIKQFTGVVIDPITVELGLLSPGMLQWIQGAWARSEMNRRHGQITYANAHMKTMFEHEFCNALLTEVMFPTLDGGSKDGGYMTCKFQPESVRTRSWPWPGPSIKPIDSKIQKMWSPSAFRFNIDGIQNMEYVNRLESFKIEMKNSQLTTGAYRLPEFVPMAITFPNLVGTMSLRYAESMIRWHREYIRNMDGGGISDTQALKTGSIDFLTPDRQRTIFQIKLEGVGMQHLNVVKATANSDQIQRVRFELFVRKMTLVGSNLLGFA